MRLSRVILLMVVLSSMTSIAIGQTALDRAGTSEILDELVARRPTTWLPAGTIEAKHHEYRAPKVIDAAEVDAAIQDEIQAYQNTTSKIERSEELQKLYLDAIPFNTRYELANEYTMDSKVIVKYDGKKFYWSIAVTSRTDSVKPTADLAGNYMLDRFDLNAAKERVFVWDGQAYTIYSVTSNLAMVDAADRLPRAVNGPLTAGVIPWGQGALSSANLASSEVSAAEVSRDGTTQIELTIESKTGLSMTCVLDPAKDYAVTSCQIISPNNTVASQYYSGYRQVAGNWLPTTILIEKSDLFTNRLLASDKWDLTGISAAVPGAEAFTTSYRADTVVEYQSPVSTKSAVYNYSNAADTDALLAERLSYVAAKPTAKTNCATVALKRAATQLGKSISDSALAAMVDATGQTSLSALLRTARGAGLYARAVRTDVATLKDLPDTCQAILHIPGKSHFVLLDRIDDRDAWIVDLSNPKFYYRQDKNFLPLDWSEGIALLISTRPISDALEEVQGETLRALWGGAGYTCTKLLQSESYTLCSGDGYDCWGSFTWYYQRWGCEAAASGSCIEQSMARYARTKCIFDTLRLICTNDGIWYMPSMSACD